MLITLLYVGCTSDLWGDTVNVASRMEYHGTSGRVQLTSGTYKLIKDDFICELKESIVVKGKEQMPIWHVLAGKASYPMKEQSSDKRLHDRLVSAQISRPL